MRNSKQIYSEIEKQKRLIRTKEKQVYQIEDKIRTLETMRLKAIDREQLLKDGIFLTVIDVKKEICDGFGGSYAQYTVRTKEGHSWIQMKKVKVGDKVLKSKSRLEATKRHIEELRKEGYNIRD